MHPESSCILQEKQACMLLWIFGILFFFRISYVLWSKQAFYTRGGFRRSWWFYLSHWIMNIQTVM